MTEPHARHSLLADTGELGASLSGEGEDRLTHPEFMRLDPDRSYLIIAAALWTTDHSTIQPAWLLVKNRVVQALGAGPPPGEIEAQSMDLRSFYLTPGLIDAHVHLGCDSASSQENTIVNRLTLAEKCGLVAVRDGGDRTGRTLANRKTIEKKLHIAASGTALYRPGRYGSFLGRAVTSKREIQQAIHELAELGADQIKVIASGPVNLDQLGQVGPPQFSVEELIDLVNVARNVGLPVMAHANGPEAVRSCALAGASSVEHGYFMGDEAMRLLADLGVTWVPTVAPLAALWKVSVSATRTEVIEKTIAHQLDQLATASHVGVKLATGSDTGSPGVTIGPGLYQEMALWRQAGFSGEDILAAATINAARLFPTGHQLGRLAAGSKAYFLGFSATDSLGQALTKPPALIVNGSNS